MHCFRVITIALSSAIVSINAYPKAIPQPEISASPAALGSGPAALSLPSAMRFCGVNCFTLKLKGGHYDAYQDGYSQTPASTYFVERFTADSVRLSRVDIKGPGRAILTGKISPEGNRLSDAVLTWTAGLDLSGPVQLTWGTALQTASKTYSPQGVPTLQITTTLPPVMRLCSSNCFKLFLKDGGYDAYGENFPPGSFASRYTVIAFSPESVVLARSDVGAARSVLRGKLSPQGDSIIDGKIEWINQLRGNTYPVAMAWGDSLMTATRVVQPLNGPQCVLGVPDSESAETEYQNGHNAWNMRDFAQSYCWNTKSAGHGNAKAMTLLGLAYATGAGPMEDLSRAFDYYKSAAESGDPRGEYLLARAYAEGIGTAVDEPKSHIWMDKALATEEGRAIDAEAKREAAEARAQQRAENFFARLVFSMIMGGDDDDSDVQRDMCGNDISKPHMICMSAGRAAQLNHLQ